MVSCRAQFPALDEVSAQVEELVQAQVQVSVQAGKMVLCLLVAKMTPPLLNNYDFHGNLRIIWIFNDYFAS